MQSAKLVLLVAAWGSSSCMSFVCMFEPSNTGDRSCRSSGHVSYAHCGLLTDSPGHMPSTAAGIALTGKVFM